MANTVPTLPDDVLHIVCYYLFCKRDFNTLFSCALSSKGLAFSAIPRLYRMHDVAPVTSRGRDEDVVRIGKQRETEKALGKMVEKWAILWRSMIMSSFQKTLFPYSRYVRVLDLKDLINLLEDFFFKSAIRKRFFADELAEFFVEVPAHRGQKRLETNTILKKAGEALIKESPLVEELSTGDVSSETLQRWIPNLPNLETLTVWNGAALIGVGRKLKDHCPRFKCLDFYGWTDSSHADVEMSKFVGDLRPQSLSSLQIYSECLLTEKTYATLNSHYNTLSDLRLWNVTSEMLLAFPALEDCNAMITLQLMSDRPTTDLETVQGVLSSLTAWLSSCKGLKSILLKHITGASAMLTPVLLQEDVRLTSLSIEGPTPQDSIAFHKALGNQVALQTLRLGGGPDQTLWSGSNDLNTLVESICKLERLTDLHLREVSDGFWNEEVQKLAHGLPGLEEFGFNCHFVDDDLFPALSGLRHLRRLDVNGLSKFSPRSLTNYVDDLGPDNTRMVLSINQAHWENPFTEDFQEEVRERMVAQLDGRFEYIVARDPTAMEDFDSDSDYA